MSPEMSPIHWEQMAVDMLYKILRNEGRNLLEKAYMLLWNIIPLAEIRWRICPPS